MKASHGSPKKVQDIIGREKEMNEFWNVLEKKSIVIASLRRMGKTCTLQKMNAQPREGWKAIHYFVQGKKNPTEFVDGLYKILVENGFDSIGFNKLKLFYDKNIGGKQFGNFNMPEYSKYWKEILEKIMEDLSGLPENKIVLMIDEFPMMLWSFINEQDLINEAIELLDIMRKIRERHESSSDLRFIFCGSIGLNMVLDKLSEEHKYVGEPINNMHKTSVLEMTDEDALKLCEHLWTDKYNSDKGVVFKEIVKMSDNLPFFIDHVFTKIQSTGKKDITSELVQQVIEELIADPNNNNEFDHFVKRIKIYYPEKERALSLKILTILSKYEMPVGEDIIINELKLSEDMDSWFVKEVFKQLHDDLFLKREIKDDARYYHFRYQLLRKWWKFNYA